MNTLLLLLSLLVVPIAASTLRPQTNRKRLALSLDGLWNFCVGEFAVPIAVPASYNDLAIGYSLTHDFAGTVSYTRADVIVPDEWRANEKRIVLRIGSASYASWAIINGVQVGQVHRGLGMPFEIDVSDALRFGAAGPNNITICVNNERSWSTLPPGYTSNYYSSKVNRYWDGLYDY